MQKRKDTLGIVVRVSDVKGRDKKGDRFISPAEQIAQASGYCKGAGFDVRVIDPQDLNVSHTTPLDERDGMSEALRLLAEGEIHGLAFSSQDRIGTLAITRDLKRRLLDAGAVLKVADNPAAEVLDAKGYLKLPSEYMSLMHEAQREEIGLRWATAQRNALARGVLPQREAYGWARAQDGRVVTDTEASKRMREAFELRAAGESYSAIARRFGWSHSTARQRIMNPAYMGVPGLVPAIVSPDLWEQANATRTSRPVPPGERTRDRLLLGLARCAGCGRTLKVVDRDGSGGTRVPRYYCKNAASESCTDRALVLADALDAFVGDWFSEALREVPRMIDVMAAAEELEQANGERDRAERELEAYVENTPASLDAAVYRRGLDKRQANVDDARARVREVSTRVARIPAGGSLIQLWEGFAVPERRDVLRGFVDRVEVSQGASRDLVTHVRIFWADGTVALSPEVADDEAGARVAAA
jgi:DNA invertase Pin-like site-specific DNA recombinase